MAPTLQCKQCCCDGFWCLGLSTCLVLMTRPLLHLTSHWCTIVDGAHSRHFHPHLPARLMKSPRVQAPALLLVTSPIASTLSNNTHSSGTMMLAAAHCCPATHAHSYRLHAVRLDVTRCACAPLCSTAAIPPTPHCSHSTPLVASALITPQSKAPDEAQQLVVRALINAPWCTRPLPPKSGPNPVCWLDTKPAVMHCYQSAVLSCPRHQHLSQSHARCSALHSTAPPPHTHTGDCCTTPSLADSRPAGPATA